VLGVHPRIIPESLNAAQSLQTALETLRARLTASLRMGELVAQFKVCEAYCEHLRRPSHVTRDDLRSVAIMLRDRVPALRHEYALALRAFVSAGGRLGIRWLYLVDYYLRLGFRQELLPWRYWTPPATLGRWPSVYMLVYGTAWLLNAILSAATVITVLAAFWVFIAEPIYTAGAQLSFPAFLQAVTVTLYIGLSIYNSFGNPITPLFSFWATPWYLVSRLWRSLRALGGVVWRLVSNPLRRLSIGTAREGQSFAAPTQRREQVLAVPTQRYDRYRHLRALNAVVSIVAALGIFGVLPFVGREARDRVTTPPAVVGWSAPDPIAPPPSFYPPLPQPTVSEQTYTYERLRADLEGQLATFRSDLKQFIQREGELLTVLGEMDMDSADWARDEFKAKALDDKKFLDELEEIRQRGEALLDRVRAIQAARTRLAEEARNFTAVARSLKTMQSAGDDRAFLVTVGEELAAATRNLLARERELEAGDAALDELVLAAARYRYLTRTELARLQALHDDFELYRERAKAALGVIESLLKGTTGRAYESLSQVLESLRRQSAESLEALAKADDSDDAGALGLWDVITTARALKERVVGGRDRVDKLFGTAHAVIEEIDLASDKFANSMMAMTEDHAKLVKEGALYPEVDPGSLEEQIRMLHARSEPLAQEQQRARAGLDMLKNQLDNVVQSASTQADDIAAKAEARLVAKGWGLAQVGGILIPLLLAGSYTMSQLRERRLITEINASRSLVILLQIATNSAHTLFVRRAAVNRIAGECFADLEALDKIKWACRFIESQGHRNDTWIAGQLAREAHGTERRIKEAESIL